MDFPKLRALAVLLCGAVTSLASGPLPAADLAVGDVAPDFTLAGSDGKQHHLADYRGTAVVVAWFPKAFTGG
jgi:peroxiredoxin Q/BCP